MESFKRSLEVDKEKIEVEEGVDLYEEDIAKNKEKYLDEIDKTIEYLLEDYGNLFNERLSSFSDQLKLEIFNRLIETDPGSILCYMDSFGILPEKYQSKIYNLLKNSNSGSFSMRRLFKTFDRITDQKLSSWCLSPDRKWDFQIIAKNKEKLPLASDEDILNLTIEKTTQYPYKGYFDWNSIVTVFDKFPNLNKDKVIEGIFKMRVNNNPGILIDHYEKLGLSQRELIDLFFEKKLGYKVVDKIGLISKEYHQEIIEKSIEEGNTWTVLNNSNKFIDIDIASVIQKILSISTEEKGSGKIGVDLITEIVDKLPKDWLKNVPQYILNQILEKNPFKILKIFEKIEKKIDAEQIIQKLFESKNFKIYLRDNTSLICDFIEKQAHIEISQETQEIIKRRILEFIKEGNLLIYSVTDQFNISKDFYESDEIKESAILGFLNSIKADEDDYNTPSLLQKQFKISLQEVFTKLPNDQKTRIEMFEVSLPGFMTKVFSSIEIFASVLTLSHEEVQSLINNPNLLKSFEENPVMAVKLLIKYPQFGESPKENIDFILGAKQRILEHNSGVDSNPHQFRLLMQEQLKPYRRNMDMITQMKEEGINVEQWLNYDEELLFELGGEQASYAELIKLPSERIQQTLKKYEEVIKDTLSAYKKELLTKQVSLVDISELDEKIKQMEQLALESIDVGNQGKAQGIQKGIEGLQKQIENPKQIPAWLKIMSDVDTVTKLFAKVMGINISIAELDTELTTLSQDRSKESQKKMFETKQKIKQKSEEFVSLLHTTSLRLDSLLSSIENSLTQTLGEDASKYVISSLGRDLREDREHFNSDKTTLENVFKMNELDDGVKGSLLKIKVWDRNPDIDLYMGNYTDCCIRIDSEYHGSESPISDYITDLGIQIVAVYDEKTGKPFAVAWCFVGEDENQNKALVIDNIEAMGPCLQYKDDIQTKLKTYIEQYAKVSGLEVVSQGPYNNDMIVTQNLEEKYTKLGGYNVTDGYYLEAEPDDEDEDPYYVNEDLEQEEFERLEKVKEQRLINEYARTPENIVSLEEALNRAQNS